MSLTENFAIANRVRSASQQSFQSNTTVH